MLAPARNAVGGAWGPDGTILFAPNTVSPLLRIPESGGAAVAATQLDPLQNGHIRPAFRPDGRYYLFSATGDPKVSVPLRVPRAVAEAFGRRLEGVDAACRAALLIAAVCGTDLRLITDVCAGMDVDPALLGEAEDLDLVSVRDGRVEFRHPLLRAAVYSGAPAPERHAAHRAAAAALPAGDVDRRAWHLAEATWHPDAAVADLLAEAGGHAAARAAYAVAASAFERSARLTPDGADRSLRLLRAADAAWTGGNGPRALALLDERAREAPADRGGETATPSVARAPAGSRDVELRASIAARTGSLRDALELLVVAADLATSADDQAMALADAVHATYYLGDARAALRLGERIDALLPAVTSTTARALGLMASGMARTLAGRRGADAIRAAVPLLETDPALARDPRRLSWLLLAPLYLRDASSGARLRALVDEVRGAAGVGALPAVLFHVAVDQATTGAAWARAEANFAEAIRLASETGQDTELAMSLAGLTRLDARAGRADACRAHGEEARSLCAARDIHVGEVWVAHALGDLELSLGHPEATTTMFEDLRRLLDALGLDDVDLDPAPELTDALLRVGRREDAAGVARAFRDRAAGKGQPWALARADRASGLAADDDGFEPLFASALEWHAQTLDRFEDARTRLAYGSRLRRVGRRVDARAPLRAAFDAFAELGAALWRVQAASELAATGEHVREPGARATERLTPQELQVSLLLADGRTTREAAAALFLSPKTVEYHLRKVYTKLEIGSRTELAEALAEDDPSR